MNIRRLVLWSIIGTGISSVATQLIIIREFLTQFQGNEITISLTLFSWLLLTGIGSLFAKAFKRSSLSVYGVLCMVISLAPLVQILLIRGLRETLFIHGASPGFYPIFLYVLLTVAPYCLLIGFILPYALAVLHDNNFSFSSGDLYITDNIGDITGGVLFSFILVYWFKPFIIIALTSSFLILVALAFTFKLRRYVLFISCLLSTGFFFYYSVNPVFETRTLAAQYGDILHYVESPFGRIVITKEGPQHTFWESGVPLYSDANVVKSEEKIHYALSQLDKVEDVLLISGGLGGTLAETSKYGPETIDYLELDPHLTDIASEIGIIKQDPRLNILNMDGRHYIKTSRKQYDAIIVDLPDPSTFQLNRFFTSEFFSLTKKILKQGGILSMGVTYSPNYLSEVRKNKLTILFNTARSQFKNVVVLPGGEAYFLCRDGEIRKDIPDLLKERAIPTSYVEGFFHGNVTEDRIRQIEGSLKGEKYINTDFEPRLINIVFQEWFMKHGSSPKYFLLALLILSAIYLIFMKKEEYVLFSTGLATMGVEMLVIFSFQVIYGYIYLKIGAIITVFLLGLLPGAFVGNISKGRDRTKLFVSEMLLLGLLFLFLLWVVVFRNELHQFYFLAYCFLFSFLCGYQFPIAAGMIGEKGSPAAACLAADLTGASIGTLVTGTILIPLTGIRFAVFFLIMVKISSAMIILLKKEKRI